MKPATLLAVIVFLVATNIATVTIAQREIDRIKVSEASKLDEKIVTLDNFYYGFCQDAKDNGYSTLKSYPRLCGNQ